MNQDREKSNISLLSYRVSIIAAIFILAFSLRLLGLWHDYPYSFYPDEAHFVKRALSFGSLDFNPHWFHKPAFYMYILFFEYGFYFVIGKIVGMWESVNQFAVAYIKNPGPFYIIGRMTTVAFSLGSIWIVYLLGEKHFRKNVGLIAALLLSLSYGHIAASQDIKADTPTTFFAILSMLFLLTYLKEAKHSSIVLSAVFAGMGTATKYYPIVMLLPIIMTIFFVQWDSDTKSAGQKIVGVILWIILSMFVFWGTYFICSPYNFIDPLGREWTFGPFSGFLRKLTDFFLGFGGGGGSSPADVDPDRIGVFEGFLHYLGTLFHTKGMGVPIASLCSVGYAWLLFKINKKNLIFLIYPTVFIFVSVVNVPGYASPRHQLPIYPFLVISGGYIVTDLARRSFVNGKALYAVLLMVLIYPLIVNIDRGIQASKLNTRNVAKSWIERNIPSGTKIIIDDIGPRLMQSESNLREMLKRAQEADPSGQFTAHFDTYLEYQIAAGKDSVTYDLHEIRWPWWRSEFTREGIHELESEEDRDFGNPLRPVGVKKYKEYVAEGFEYAVIVSNNYNWFLSSDSKNAEKYPSVYQLYRDIFDNGVLVKEFSPDDGNLTGPVIKIFKMVGEGERTSSFSHIKSAKYLHLSAEYG